MLMLMLPLMIDIFDADYFSDAADLRLISPLIIFTLADAIAAFFAAAFAAAAFAVYARRRQRDYFSR